ncbi:MAG TPA: DUF4097 family beta strand repeat-containing protein [Dehalococcoidia bacterium]|nr:DUF4097 family beta strand repeat-containing protein [Dehalococcoidia bacterium]
MDLYRRSFRRQVDTGHQARLRVENRNGRVDIASHEEPGVTIEVTADIYAASEAEADELLRRLQEAITVEGDRVEVFTPELRRPEFGIFFFGRGPKVDYDIRVPADTEVQVTSRNGPVRVRGTRRPVRVENRNGRVTLEDVAADVTVENNNGRTSVTRCAGGVTVSTTNGAVSVERPGGDVDVSTRNGAVEVQDPLAGVKATSTNGPVRFSGKVNGDVELQATNGGIRMAVTADSRFEIDAQSVHGGVHSDLPVRETPPGGESGPLYKVRLRTVNGGIRLTEL